MAHNLLALVAMGDEIPVKQCRLAQDWTADIITDARPGKIACERIVIPKGFVIDGRSMPSIVRKLMGSLFVYELRFATAVHDFLYSKHTFTRLTRRQADIAFRELLVHFADTKGVFKAFLVFWLVRLLGWALWKRVV